MVTCWFHSRRRKDIISRFYANIFITISKGVTFRSYTSKISFNSLKFLAYTNTALKPKINLIKSKFIH